MAKKALPPALAFMNKRVKELHAAGKPMKDAMRQAGREWHKVKGSGASGVSGASGHAKARDSHVARKRNPPALPGGVPALSIAPGFAESSGGRYEFGDPVHFRSSGKEGIVAGSKRGPERKGFLGLWTTRDKPAYAVAVPGGYLKGREDELRASNPLMGFVTPWTLAVAGLILWGVVSRRQESQVPPPEESSAS